jgi:predicted ATPase/DNA-binding CsgD family transcriptional regulator
MNPTAAPATVPWPATSFIGRDEELRALTAMLGKHRLVTLTGAGGSGKTRLAQQVAHDVSDRSGEGVWWADLQAVSDERRLASAIAEAAGLDEVAGRGAGMMLVAGLADRHGLLVLDNCEHVLDPLVELVTPLVAYCPRVTLLATSRELLDLDGEHALRVRPLAVPPGGDLTAEELSHYPAARLFLERAAAVTELTPTDDDAVAIARICRHLDGLPLAIELAAAQMRVLSVQALADGLDHRFGLLVGHRRAVSRQRTLEASIGWSYDRLPGAEQAALARLSVFPGAFDLAAATDVIGLGAEVGDHAALHLLTALVDKSLVTVLPTRSERRYRLLESIRHYAADRLEERGERAVARDAHLDHVVRRLRWGTCGLSSARLRELHGTPELREELEDVRTAQAHAQASARIGDVVDLHWSLFLTHLVNGTYREPLSVLRTLLDADLDPRRRTIATSMVIAFLTSGGRPVEADQLSDDTLAAARDLDDELVLLAALLATCHARTWTGRGGLDLPREAWALALAHRDDWGEATTAAAGLYAGVSLSHLGAGPEGLEVLLAAVDEARRASDWHLAAMAGTYAAAEGFRLPLPPEEARQLVEETRALVPEHAPRLRSPHCSLPATIVALFTGRLDEARRSCAEGAALAGPIGSGTHAINAAGRAAVALVADDPDQALRAARLVHDLFAHTSNRWWQLFAEDLLVWAHVERGDWEEAQRVLDEAWDALPDPPVWPVIRGRLAAGRGLLLSRRDPAAALGHLLDELASCWSSGHRVPAPTLVWLAAAAMLALERTEDAARALGVSDALRAGWTMAHSRVLPQVEAAAVEAIGEATVARLRAEGAATPPHEGVAWLLRGRGRNVQATVGWEALTATERAVAVKVAAGLTNKDVAEALFVSPNTVKTHLRNAYTKLGITGRAALATEVTRHQH